MGNNDDEDFLLGLDYRDLMSLLERNRKILGLINDGFWKKKIKHDFGSFYPEHYLQRGEQLTFDQAGYDRLYRAHRDYLRDVSE